jgi:hypothetical protein
MPFATEQQAVDFVLARFSGHRAIPQFVVMTAAAPKPSSCWGNYKRVAVVETNCIDMPKQINPIHATVVRIVRTWEMCNVGGARSAFAVAKREAEALAAELNSGNH